MATERLSVEEIEPAPRRPILQAISTPEPIAHSAEPIAPPAPPAPAPRDDVAILRELYRLMGAALSARALLAVAFAGAFVLSILAVWRGSLVALATVVVYALATIGPIVILELNRKS